MKKNGFTLIELLAVIAVLAIILLIAVPQVLSTINDSTKASLKSSAQMIWDAAEECIMKNQIDSTLCAIPTVQTTTAGYSGYNNMTGLPGLPAGKITAPASVIANWAVLPAMTTFAGTYMVELNITTPTSPTVYRVYVSNTTSKAVGLFNGGSDKYCWIASKNGAATCPNS